jgi:hypothetical protein
VTVAYGERTNGDKARWARDALAAYTQQTYGGRSPEELAPEDVECAIYDLIADLRHYTDRLPFLFDWERIERMAAWHHTEEVLEELDDTP